FPPRPKALVPTISIPARKLHYILYQAASGLNRTGRCSRYKSNGKTQKKPFSRQGSIKAGALIKPVHPKPGNRRSRYPAADKYNIVKTGTLLQSFRWSRIPGNDLIVLTRLFAMHKNHPRLQTGREPHPRCFHHLYQKTTTGNGDSV